MGILETWSESILSVVSARIVETQGKCKISVVETGPVSRLVGDKLGLPLVDAADDLDLELDDREFDFRFTIILCDVPPNVEGELLLVEDLIRKGWRVEDLPVRLDSLWAVYGEQPDVEIYEFDDDDDEPDDVADSGLPAVLTAWCAVPPIPFSEHQATLYAELNAWDENSIELIRAIEAMTS